MRFSFFRWAMSTATVTAVALLCIGRADADLVTIHLSDGTASTVELVGVEANELQWKENALPNSPVRSYPRAKISHVDFPETGAWRDAESAFESGKISEAIRLYQDVIATPAEHFYPLPGNFVSLAKLRILECQRTTMNPAAIAKQAELVKKDFANLPPAMRTLGPVIDAWAAVAKRQWDGVLESLATVEFPGPESFFLQGVALENLGKWQEALEQYSSCYVLNFGASAELTRQALRRAASLLAEHASEDRMPELQAQVKLYRELFGDGKLWSDADPQLIELAEGKIDALKIAVEGDFDGEAAAPMETAKPQADAKDSKAVVAKPAEKAQPDAGNVVVKESPTMATLPVTAERDYLLPEELDERAFVIGPGGGKGEVKIVGGVTGGEDGYVFDGTGGGIRIQPVAANQATFVFKILFVAQSPDGAIADMNDGNKGGFGLYLQDGNVIFAWASKREKLKKWNLGKVVVGKPANVYVNVNSSGKVIAVLGGTRQEFKIRKGAHGLSPQCVMYLGDIGEIGVHSDTVIGTRFTPFKGVIKFASIETGKNGADIRDRQLARFGKRVVMTPPPPPVEAPQPEPAESKPQPKPTPTPTPEAEPPK